MAITGASLQPIYDRLHAMSAYHPMSADTFTDWSVEAGDVVTMVREGENYASPIHNARIVWRGAPQITLNATGREEREAIAKISKRKYGRGAGMRNDQRIYYDMYDDGGFFHSELEYTASRLEIEFDSSISSLNGDIERLHSELEFTASRLRTEFDNEVSSLHGELQMTASRLETEFEDDVNSLYGALEMTASHFQVELDNTASSLRGEFMVAASGMWAVFEDEISSLRGDFEVTASRLQTEFEDDVNSLYGALEMTASHFQVELDNTASSLRGEFAVTASGMWAVFEDQISSLHGEIELTASRLQTEFGDDINSLHGELQMTASRLETEFSDDVNSLRGALEMTASHFQVALDNTASSLHGEIELTASRLQTEFGDDVSSLRGELEMTASHFQVALDNTASSLHGEIELTASRLQTEFSDDVSSLRGELEMTASHFQVELDNTASSLRGEIELTASRLQTEFSDDVSSLRGELQVTAAGLQAEFEAGQSSLRGELEMTASRLQTEFDDGLNSLHGELEMTASHFDVELDNTACSLRGEMELTASGLRTEFESEISSLHSEVVQTDSSWRAAVSGVVGSDGKVTAASIAVAINASTGESEAKVSADKVFIGNQTSTTVINGKCSLSDVTANYINSQIANLGTLNTLSISASGNISSAMIIYAKAYMVGESAPYRNISNPMMDIQLTGPSNNIYTLQYKKATDDSWQTVGTFSRATALNGAWSSGKLTVTASPQDETFERTIIQDTTHAEWGAGYVNVPILSQWSSGGSSYTEQTGQSVYISFSNKLDPETTYTRNGTYYPSEGKMGISSVIVDVPSSTVTPTINSSWNNSGQQTISTTPAASANLVTQFYSVYGSNNSVHYIYTQSKGSTEGTATTRLAKVLALDYGTVSSGSRMVTVKYDGSNTGLTYTCSDYGDGQRAATLSDNWSSAVHTIQNASNSSNKIVTTMTSVCEYDSTASGYFIHTKSQNSNEGTPTKRISKALVLNQGSVSSGSRTISVSYGGSATGLSYVCPDYGDGQRAATLSDSWAAVGSNNKHTIWNSSNSNNKIETTITSVCEYDSSASSYFINTKSQNSGEGSPTIRIKRSLTLDTGSVSSGSRTIQVKYGGNNTGLTYTCPDYGNGQKAATLSDSWGTTAGANNKHTIWNSSNSNNKIETTITSVCEYDSNASSYFINTKSQNSGEGSPTIRIKRSLTLDTGSVSSGSRTIQVKYAGNNTGLTYSCPDYGNGQKAATLSDSWGTTAGANNKHTIWNSSNSNNKIETTITSVCEYDSSASSYFINTKSQNSGEGSPTIRIKRSLTLDTGSVSSGSRTIQVKYAGNDTGLTYTCPDYGNGQRAATLSDSWAAVGSNNKHTIWNSSNSSNKIETTITSVCEYDSTASSYFINTKSQNSGEGSPTIRIKRSLTLDTGSVSSGSRTIQVKYGGNNTGLTYTCPDYGNGQKAATLSDNWGTTAGSNNKHTIWNSSNSSNKIETTITSVCEYDSNASSYFINTKSQNSGEGSPTIRIKRSLTLDTGSVSSGSRTIQVKYAGNNTGLTYSCPDYGNGQKAATLSDSWGTTAGANNKHTIWNSSNSNNKIETTITSVCEYDSSASSYFIHTKSQNSGEGSPTIRIKRSLTLDTGSVSSGSRTIQVKYAGNDTGLTYTCPDYGNGQRAATLSDSWAAVGSNNKHTIWNSSNSSNKIETTITSVCEYDSTASSYFINTKSQNSGEGSPTIRIKRSLTLDTGSVSSGSRTIQVKYAGNNTGLTYSCPDYGNGQKAATLSDSWGTTAGANNKHTIWNSSNSNNKIETTITSVCEYDSNASSYFINTKSQNSGEGSPTIRIKRSLTLDTGSVSSGSRTIQVKYAGNNTGLTYVCPDYGNGQKAATLSDSWSNAVHTIKNASNADNKIVTTISSVCEASNNAYFINTKSQNSGDNSPTTRISKALALSTGSVDSTGVRSIGVNYGGSATGLTFSCQDYKNAWAAAYDKYEIPNKQPDEYPTSLTVKGPSSAIGSQSSRKYTFLNDSTDPDYGFFHTTSPSVNVARFYHGQYTAGRNSVTVPTGKNIVLGSFQYSSTQPSQVTGQVENLSTLRSLMINYSNGYVWFKASLSNGTGARWFKVSTVN